MKSVFPNPPPTSLSLLPPAKALVLDHALLRLARALAMTPQLPGVIYGETGTGKEEFARLVHGYRCRQGTVPFIAVNCASLDSQLADSLLFGHTRGAFSGAERETTGFVGAAHQGILFLDEIHHLPAPTQRRLLRVLHNGAYQRLGEVEERKANLQVIAASTRNLDEEVRAGHLLLDLRCRLTGIEVKLKPLRERKEDLPALLALFFKEEGVAVKATLIDELNRRCRDYYWQGNIRQLFQALKTMLALAQADGAKPTLKYLPVYRSMLAPVPEQAGPGFEWQDLGRKVAAGATPWRELVAQFERLVLAASLKQHRRVCDSYRTLGMSRNNFGTKCKRYGLVKKYEVERES